MINSYYSDHNKRVLFRAIKGCCKTLAILPLDIFSANILQTELENLYEETIDNICNMLPMEDITYIVEYKSKQADVDDCVVTYTLITGVLYDR